MPVPSAAFSGPAAKDTSTVASAAPLPSIHAIRIDCLSPCGARKLIILKGHRNSRNGAELWPLPLAPAPVATAERGDDPAPGADILLGRAHAMKHVADGAHHCGSLLRRAQETASVELALQVLEKSEQLGTGCLPRAGKIETFLRRTVACGGAAERR